MKLNEKPIADVIRNRALVPDDELWHLGNAMWEETEDPVLEFMNTYSPNEFLYLFNFYEELFRATVQGKCSSPDGEYVLKDGALVEVTKEEQVEKLREMADYLAFLLCEGGIAPYLEVIPFRILKIVINQYEM